MHLECQIEKKIAVYAVELVCVNFLKGVCFYFICVNACLHVNMYMVYAVIVDTQCKRALDPLELSFR